MFPTSPEDLVEAGDAPSDREWNSTRVEYQSFARFVKMTKEIRELEARIKEKKQLLEDLSFQLRDYLGSSGYQNVAVDGYTVFLRRDLFVRARDGMNQDLVCDVLKRNGLSHFVKEQYSVSALSSHVRELERERQDEFTDGLLTKIEELLPPEVAQVLNCDPKFSVIAQVRPGGKR